MKKLSVFGVFISIFLIGYDFAYLDAALVKMQKELGFSIEELIMTINAFIFFLASCLLGAGHLSDRLGNKKVFMTGLFGMGLAALIFAFSKSYWLVFSMRSVQGICAALILPSSLALLISIFKGSFQKAVFFFLCFFGLGVLAGPLVFLYGGAFLGWNMGIFITFAIAACAFFLSGPLQEKKEGAKLDILAIALSFAASAVLIFTILRNLDLEVWQTIVLLALSIGLFTLYYFYKNKTQTGIDSKLFFQPHFIMASVCSFLFVFFAWIGYFATAIFLQNLLLKSPYALEALLFCVPLAFILTAYFSSYITPNVAILSGGGLLGLGFVLQGFFNLQTTNFLLVISLLCIGGGIGLALVSLSCLALQSVKSRACATISSVLLFIQSLGVVIGLALTGALIRFQGELAYFRKLAGRQTGNPVKDLIKGIFKSPQKVVDHLKGIGRIVESSVVRFLQESFIENYQVIMFGLAVASILLAVALFFGMRKKWVTRK
jgi:MFS family permease